MMGIPELYDSTARLHPLERRRAGPEALRCYPETVHVMRPVSFAFSSHELVFLHWYSSIRCLLERKASMAGMDHTGRAFSEPQLKGVGVGELTRLLFLRHLSHAALTLVGSCRVADVFDIDKKDPC